MRKAKIEFAWIEQIMSFGTEADKQNWLMKRETIQARRNLGCYIKEEWEKDGRWFIRIRQPYNQNTMWEGD